MENELKTDGRISAALSFVRRGSVVADIGTDHGYIPIYLVTNGVSPFAYASDVNRMPLERARTNAAKYGVGDRIRFCLSDGLRFIDEGKCEGRLPDDIVICGMGGELIADIIGASEYARTRGVRLILQPMTRTDRLREYLAENGFSIVDERLCTAAGKLYAVICAEYVGGRKALTRPEALLGEANIARGGEMFTRYAEAVLDKLTKKIDGLTAGGHHADAEKALYDEIKEIIKGRKK